MTYKEARQVAREEYDDLSTLYGGTLFVDSDPRDQRHLWVDQVPPPDETKRFIYYWGSFGWALPNPVLYKTDEEFRAAKEACLQTIHDTVKDVKEDRETPIELDDLDALLDDESFDITSLEGRMADWHGTIAPVRVVNGRVYVTPTVKCGRCRKKETVLHCGSGLHSGAFCYVFDPETGAYQANLRDENWICEECHQEKKESHV